MKKFVYGAGRASRGNANIIKVQTIPNATVDFATLKMPFGRLIYLNTEGVSVPSDQGPSESLGSQVPPEPAQWNAPEAPHGASPARTSSPIPSLPQECHVVLGVNRVAEDVAFQGGRGLLQPEKQRVAGAQADLEIDGQK